MPEFMPYTTEKSLVFQVIESFVNGSRARALESLWTLVEMNPVTNVQAIDSTNLNPPENPGGYPNAAARRQHVEHDWWGWEQPPPAPGAGDQFDPKQQPYDPLTNPTTGFWQHWFGNAEAVFRETMIRALTVSLGLPRTATRTTPGNTGNQHWPISILWK